MVESWQRENVYDYRLGQHGNDGWRFSISDNEMPELMQRAPQALTYYGAGTEAWFYNRGGEIKLFGAALDRTVQDNFRLQMWSRRCTSRGYWTGQVWRT